MEEKRKKTVDAKAARKKKLIELTCREGGFPLISKDKEKETLCKLLSDNDKLLTKKTIENYISQLEQDGYRFERRKERIPKGSEDRWLYYYVCTQTPSVKDAEFPEVVQKKKKEDAQEALYLFILSTFFYREKVDMKTFANFVYGNELYPSQLSRHMAILKRMQEKGLIRVEDKKIFACADERKSVCVDRCISEKISEDMTCSEKYIDFTYAVCDELSCYNGALNAFEQKVKEKYDRLTGEQQDGKIRYFRREKINSEIANAQLIHEKLSGIPYKSKAIKVTYRSNKDKMQVVNIYTGLFHFSKNKDALFLLGRNVDSRNKYENIKVSAIEKVETLSIDNAEFDSVKMNAVYNEMFDATCEEKQRVVVLVKDQGQVKDKFFHLAAVRRAEFTEITTQEQFEQIMAEEQAVWLQPDIDFAAIHSGEAEKIYLYRDWIRGMSDFSSYLMQFGRSCVALAPTGLRKNISSTMKTLLERYAAEQTQGGDSDE